MRRIILIITAVLVGGGIVFVWLRFGGQLTTDGVRMLAARLGVWGPLALVAGLAALLVVPVLPATVFQVGAGLAWGPGLGLVLVLAADVLGAAVGFALARRWGMPLLQRWLAPATIGRLQGLAGRMSWRAVMLLRLLPGPAYPLVSFAAGLSPLGALPYMAASFAGVLPSLALLVLAGDVVTRSPVLAFALVAVFVGSLALVGRIVGRTTRPDTHNAGDS